MLGFKLDLDNDNLNNYFARHVDSMTEAQKELLPKELNYKLFKKGGAFRASRTVRLNFLTKLFVLIRCFKKNWVLLIEDEEGLGADQFFKLKDQCREEGFGVDPAESWLNRGMFVLANKELMEGFSALNRLSMGPAYNYVSKIKNIPKSKTNEWKEKALYMVNLLSHYDGIKKKITMQSGVPLPELYTLFYLYDGEEKLASSVYKERYKYTYSASRNQIQKSFITLQNKGFIKKIGFKKGAKLAITAQGIGVLEDILQKYIIDF